MISQSDAFEQGPGGLVGAEHPDTSHDAAAEAGPSIAAMHRKVLAVLAANPDGLTSQEIEGRLGMHNQTIAPRLIELRGDARQRPIEPALVVRTDEKRKTRSGRMAYVYRLSSAGWATVDQWSEDR